MVKSLFLFLTTILLSPCGSSIAAVVDLSEADANKIGQMIWRNESGGSLDGLTSWNKGEGFASLGIGHFIWYPAGERGPFQESFPKLARFLQLQGVAVPDWFLGPCPWRSRTSFYADFSGPKMAQLRSILSMTVPLQARFTVARLEDALPKMLDSTSPDKREIIRRNFFRVAAKPMGPYALVDYVNFKGEGTLLSERYHGEGWGLLQVLESMDQGPALAEFRQAADRVLTRRVHNAPRERTEYRWLPGWRNRIGTYG